MNFGETTVHTYDEIKQGLECIGGQRNQNCSDCPYHGKYLPPCRMVICEDAIRCVELCQMISKTIGRKECED
jgi:hypothetical protein